MKSDWPKGRHGSRAILVRTFSALITDLKQRGLLDQVLVLWGGEFGRTPIIQGA